MDARREGRTPGLRLSVLDQSPVSEGMGGADALHNTLDLARTADRLGYHRYWIAEHHGTPMLASPSPEVLISPVALATERIRVGSGGVMLPHYSPYKVAENFSMLAGLAPRRIDLGIGRAPGTDQQTMLALQRDRSRAMPDDFTQQLLELLAYLDDSLPSVHPFARLGGMMPGRPERPEPWLLGSSAQSGIWAAELGLPYCFADFISPTGEEIAERYRREFEGSRTRRRAEVMVAVWAICAETEAEAQRLASSARMAFALLHTGRLIPVPPVETAEAFLAQQAHDPFARRRRALIGTPESVRTQIEQVAAAYGAGEVMIVTITHSHAARRRSYELIAEAFGLAAAGGVSAAAAPR